MKIFLTGSSGFIGGHLLPNLQELGHEVITDMRYLEKEKYDLVIHLAAVTHINKEFDGWLIELNIILAKKMLRTPYRTIYASSCSAAHLTNPYAYTKKYSEWLGEKHGNALGLRFHNVYGPRNNKGIVKYLVDQPDGAKIIIRGKDTIRDYIYVDDVVDEIIRSTWAERIVPTMLGGAAIYFKNGVMDVGTGTGTTTMQLVEKFMQVSGKEFEISTTAAGDNEPLSMISNNIVPHMDLETGLIKTIK